MNNETIRELTMEQLEAAAKIVEVHIVEKNGYFDVLSDDGETYLCTIWRDLTTTALLSAIFAAHRRGFTVGKKVGANEVRNQINNILTVQDID